MRIDLTEKNVLVTGANGGIGSCVCKKLLECDAKVIGIGIGDSSSVAEEVDFYQCDLSDFDKCNEVIESILYKYGHIDVLVNGAGITNDSLTFKMSEKSFDDVIRINLKSVWNVTKKIGPLMQKMKKGSIINISSVVAIYGNSGQSNYAAAKAGIIGMTRCWAKEFSYKGSAVRVNAVTPGYTKTDMIKTVPEELLEKIASQTMLGRLASPDEIANVILFLASDLSSYITGSIICVDGGMRL